VEFNLNRKTLTIVALWATHFCGAGFAQPGPVILRIDYENRVRYTEDIVDPTKFGTLPGPVAALSGLKNLTAQLEFGDFIAVNGQPAKGTYSFYGRGIGLTAADTGIGIFDAPRSAIGIRNLEVQTADGTPVGTIMLVGVPGFPAPPGSPVGSGTGNWTVVGGTGAFLGVRGQFNDIAGTIAVRGASLTEDLANRRKNGGGNGHMLLTLFPMSRPDVLTTPRGPAVTHAGGGLVTASRPAAAGETLILHMSGLGPTKLSVDPGAPFPASPAATVNSPVTVNVNGRAAELVEAVGSPGGIDRYDVTFKLPADTSAGDTVIQVSAAWIPGNEVTIPVR
jgi:hypothetical protein